MNPSNVDSDVFHTTAHFQHPPWWINRLVAAGYNARWAPRDFYEIPGPVKCKAFPGLSPWNCDPIPKIQTNGGCKNQIGGKIKWQTNVRIVVKYLNHTKVTLKHLENLIQKKDVLQLLLP